MAHLLVSWLAYGHDFIRGGNGAFAGVSEAGPTVQFHQHFFAAGGYDEHVLLYADARQENLAERLLNELLRRHPGRAVRTELLPVRDVISLPEVKGKVETWLLQHAAHELTLYFSPGTSIMQLAWYLAHVSLGLRTHLVQTRAARFGPAGQPELLQLQVEQSATPVTAIIREQQVANRLGWGARLATARPAGGGYRASRFPIPVSCHPAGLSAPARAGRGVSPGGTGGPGR